MSLKTLVGSGSRSGIQKKKFGSGINYSGSATLDRQIDRQIYRQIDRQIEEDRKTGWDVGVYEVPVEPEEPANDFKATSQNDKDQDDSRGKKD